MARALWTGTISFGLVNIPVRLYPATRRKDVRFHEIDRFSGQRVRHQRVRGAAESAWVEESVAETHGSSQPPPETAAVFATDLSSFAAPSREVRKDEIVKGYEVSPDRFVTVSAEEIAELRPEKSKTIDIEEFVELSSVDPVHFDTGYHLAPQRDYERPFALLVAALEQSAKLAVCWIVLRQKRHLAALRPHRGLLLLTTMFFADEILPAEEIAPRRAELPSERELKMADLLVTAMSGEFDPARYEDGYRKRLLELIESRSGGAIAAQPADEPQLSSGVEDLMAALEASLKRARADSEPGAAKPAARKRRKGAA